MLHAWFTPIPICFMSTLWHYYAFSGTNLLTRCRSASSYFLLFLVSEKLYRKYSRNGTGQKPKFLICHWEDRVRRGAEGRPDMRWPRAHLWPSLGIVWAPLSTSNSASSPIYSPSR